MKPECQEWKSILETLRQKAESALPDKYFGLDDELSACEPQQLIHELRVHQIELEIQNEELRRTQLELEAAYEKYATLYDFAPVAYLTVEKNGRISEANLVAASMLGMDRGALTGKRLSTFVCREYQDLFFKHRRKTLASKDRQACELKMVKKNGEPFYARMESLAVRNAENDSHCHRTVISDITEQTRLIRQIRRDKEEWERTFNAIEDIITIQDAHMRIIRINNAGSTILKVAPENLVGKYCFEVFRGEATPCDGCPAIQAMHDFSGHATEIEHSSMGKTFQVTASPIFDDLNTFIGVVHTAKDITEQKKLETQLRQAQKIEALGSLAGGIAHDFNNILSAILGFAEIAKSGVPEGSQLHEDLMQIIKAGVRAKDLVSQILIFSRRNKAKKEPVQINLIVKEVFKLLRATLPPSIVLRGNIGAGQEKILADPTQIHQVLMNLCINSFHAMEKEGGTITVELCKTTLDTEPILFHRDLRPGPYLRLSVIDTGHGIDPSIRDRIFEPFFTTKEPGKGTGMGLSVVYKIVKNHGGAISVQSDPLNGTKFDLYFPMITRDQEAMVEENHLALGRGERILVVDDEESLVTLSQQILEHLGYQVTAETSSTNALETFRNHPDKFDLVITDQVMPHMSGTDLAANLLLVRPDIPVILCTGYNETVNPKQAKSMGIRKIMAKPFLTSEIAKAVRSILDDNPNIAT